MMMTGFPIQCCMGITRALFTVCLVVGSTTLACAADEYRTAELPSAPSTVETACVENGQVEVF